MGFTIKDYIHHEKEEEIIFSYEGEISSNLIKSTLTKIEQHLLERESLRLRKKVYNVLIESLQNLYHHVEGCPDYLTHKTESQHYGGFVISYMNDAYKIVTANFVDGEKKEMLNDKLDKIKTLSKDELKEMYKFVLNHQKLSPKGGGGLGLIDIAKKTKSNLDYNFVEFQNNWYLYILTIYVY